MTLREVYESLDFDYENNVRIYQYKSDIDDEIVIFDNIMNPDEDHIIDQYLDKSVVWFTWYPTAGCLEVHLEA